MFFKNVAPPPPQSSIDAGYVDAMDGAESVDSLATTFSSGANSHTLPSDYDADLESSSSSSTYGSTEQVEYDQEYTPYTVSSMLGSAQLQGLSAPGQVPISMGGNVDYLFQDEGRRRGEKGLSEKLCYNTGIMYGSGLVVGGVWGVMEGTKSPLPSASNKLRVNTLLNACTRRGPLIGNSAGVTTMMYTSFAHGFQKMRGEEDIVNHIAAGTLAGAIFKSTAGAKTALKTGAIFGACAAIIGTAYNYLNDAAESATSQTYSPSYS